MRIDRIDALRAFGRYSDEVTVEQCLQMLRHRGTADRKPLGKFVDRARRAPQLFQQIAPVRVSYGRKWIDLEDGQKLSQSVRRGK